MTKHDLPRQDPIRSKLTREDASFADILLQFVDGLTDRVTKMEEAIAAADFEALRVAARQLKGGGCGEFPNLTARASRLEAFAKTKALAECVAAVAELKKLCEQVAVDARD